MSETKVGSTVPLWTGGGGGGGGAPSGPAGGDLRGTYPNPIVDGLQTFPIAITAPLAQQRLVFNGIQWTPTDDYYLPAVVFRPGTPSLGNAVATWAEVAALITLNNGTIIVFIDPTFGPCEVDAVTNCFGSVIIKPKNLNAPGNTLTILDGAQLLDLSTVTGSMTLSCVAATTPSIVQNGTPLYLREGGTLQQEATATVPCIDSVFAGFGQIVSIEAGFVNNLNPAIPVVSVVSGGFFILATFINFGSPFPATTVGGDATCLLGQFADSTAPIVPQTFFAGAQFSSRLSQQAYILPASGNTASRPVTPNLDVGQSYFDTDLALPIWWTGAAWVDAAGAVV